MGAEINPNAVCSTDEFNRRMAEAQRESQRFADIENQMAAARAQEERYMQQQREEAAARAARGEQKFSDNFIPPPSSGGNNTGAPPAPGYNQDLWSLTSPAATLHGHQAHPELSGASAGNIHANPNTQLMHRDWATEQNASQSPGSTSIYSESAPVVVYRTDMPTTHSPDPYPTDMSRLHHGNVVGGYATNAQDINYGHISGSEGARRLDLPKDNPLPTHVVNVDLPIGTSVEASRPQSGEARQYRLYERIASWFTNSRKLG